ncbi:MAG: hypothetical protein PHE18_03075 [Candidatus Omnitrophica bacterium]|nr:hypothetical protein [Candidatus Omnitrophota bacterium]MDD5552837.1 hypothetical protein [Candidatus Omnitrophota bacterium]
MTEVINCGIPSYDATYEFILDKLYKLNYILRGFAANDPGIRRENLQYVYSDRYTGWIKNKEAFSVRKKAH